MNVTLPSVVVSVLVCGAIVGAQGPVAATAAPPTLAAGVREAIQELPYYGVFDLITFEIDDGTVVLGGYVYQSTLKKTAEKAALRVPGVQKVVNRIVALRTTLRDDEIRWGIYWSIYRDSPLARYGWAPRLGLGWRPRVFRPWGPGFGDGTGRRFWGMEPVGVHAIHILVDRGDVTLAGVVDTEADKRLAERLARRVLGVRALENDIEVEAERPGR